MQDPVFHIWVWLYAGSRAYSPSMHSTGTYIFCINLNFSINHLGVLCPRERKKIIINNLHTAKCSQKPGSHNSASTRNWCGRQWIDAGTKPLAPQHVTAHEWSVTWVYSTSRQTSQPCKSPLSKSTCSIRPDEKSGCSSARFQGTGTGKFRCDLNDRYGTYTYSCPVADTYACLFLLAHHPPLITALSMIE